MFDRQSGPAPAAPGRPGPQPTDREPAVRLGWHWSGSQGRLLGGILLVALVHGLLYVLLEPPWEHYEEPSHFEYAWLISNSGRLPTYPAYNQAERRAIAASMIQHGFFARRSFTALPDLTSTDQPIWIGINVTGAVPLYHILVALPLRLVAGAGVDTQLYVARLVSLLLFILTVALAYWIMAELVPPGHALRWAVPLSLALTPAFVDLMTAVNNDVGATFVFSLFLWMSVRMVVRGLTWGRLAGTLALAGLSALTKNSVLAAVPLALIPIGMALYLKFGAGRWGWPGWLAGRPTLRWGLAGLPVLAVAVALALSLDWRAPALWIEMPPPPTPVRVQPEPAVPGLGHYALGFTSLPDGEDAGGVQQIIPYDRMSALLGQKVTLGAWIWATQPVSLTGPLRLAGQSVSSMVVTAGTQPAFFAWPVTMTADNGLAWVQIAPHLPNDPTVPVTVYFDGVILTGGARSSSVPPAFSDAGATQGNWDGQPFVNEVRNGSAEQTWPTVRPWLERLFTRLAGAHLSPSVLLGALLDWRLSQLFALPTAVRLFRTFWASFAWAGIDLAPDWYIVLRYGTLLGMALAGLRLWRVFGRLSRPLRLAIIWLGVALLAIWAEVFLRGLFTVLDPKLYIPTARYAYPVVIPSMLLLVAGWSELPRLCAWAARAWPRALLPLARGLQKVGPVLFVAAFLVLDIQSVVALVAYYSK